MPFLTRQDISADIKTKAEKRYKEQLRQALRNPALTPEQRLDLRLKLQQVGKPRVYDAKSPAPPGAIQLPEEN